jgi:RNA polymerase sigma-70 factor (ECF subfamily)
MFAVAFDEIAPIVGRTPVTTKKLASRARHKVRRPPEIGAPELERQRAVVEAFLAAVRAGDVDAVISVLAPDVVRTADPATLPAGRAAEVRGPRRVAEEIAVFGARARFATVALVDGRVGLVIAPRGRLQLALVMTVVDDRIAGYELVTGTMQLARLDLALLDA